jgi:hypothetical protein
MFPRRLITAACLFALASPAFAEDRAVAERYFRMGEKAYAAQDFVAAADNFNEAFRNFELPEIAFSAAQAYRRKYRIEPRPQDVKRAVDLFTIYLRAVKTGGRVADAADGLAEMQHELDKLVAAGVDVSPELAKQNTRLGIAVRFGSDASRGMREVDDRMMRDEPVERIEAELDGKPVSAMSLLTVAPGRHRVRARAPGYAAAEQQVVAIQGATVFADLALTPLPAKVRVRTDGDARVMIDGRLIGTAPLAAFELPAGRATLAITLRGHEPVSREITVARGEEVVVDAPLAETRRRKSVPYVVASAGAFGVVALMSTTFAVIRNGDAKDLLTTIRTDGDQSEAAHARYDELRAARDDWRTAAYISGATFGLLATAAAVLYYNDNPPPPERVRVEPLTLPGGGGAAIAGRF